MPTTRTVLIANPSGDVYGSDLQMLQSVAAMRSAGHRVVVAMPADGPLVGMLERAGAEILPVDFPVLRRANASLGPFAGMLLDAVRALPRLWRTVRRVRPDVVYVNTVTLPWWLLAGRLARRPVVCHVHEAETEDRRLVRLALALPLVLADATLVISRSTMRAMCEVVPRLERRAHLVYNGVPEPEEVPALPSREDGSPWRVVVVARLSPRKAPHLALEAVATLRRAGRDVRLDLCGTAFEGYESYVAELRARAEHPDLAGAVTFSGYASPVWPALARSHMMLAPSLREPFGNAVVEAQLALRPVVATAALGHLESITDGETGLLVEVGDVEAMARATARLMDDGPLADRLAVQARRSALDRFTTTRYAREVNQLLEDLSA
jgi:glycosyltransferase involved in cell wall biosynthesis